MWRTSLRLGMALLGLLWLATVGCGGSIPWSIAPPANNSCDPRAGLRDLKGYQEASPYDDPTQLKLYEESPVLRSPYRTLFAANHELGCLVLSEAGPAFVPLSSQAVSLVDTGKVNARNQTSGKYDAAPQWSLSLQELKDKPLALTLYVLRQNAFDEKDHVNVCKELIKGKPNCFSADPQVQKNQLCWFFIQLVPDAPKESAFTFKALDNAGSCRICSRELCGNKLDDDCDGEVDEGCDDKSCHHPGKQRPCYAGPKETQAQGICRAGTQTCQALKDVDANGAPKHAWDTCIDQVLPKAAETCNGVDDNCDGQTDEGLKDCCLVGTRQACAKASGCSATQEICTFAADTGKGAWKGCAATAPPKTDVCNGEDDDCDGKIDEDYPTAPCSTGLPGDCSQGEEICQGKKGPVCVPVSKPGIELCDNIDNDCNGKTDDFFAQRGQRCTVANTNGPCAVGVWGACVNGKPRCDAISKAVPELCGDGIDNDCDGNIDDKDSDCECNPGQTGKCYPHPDKTTLGKGNCVEGTRTCQANGKWGSCQGARIPQQELCNGKDDNCDGTIDLDFPTKGKLCSTFKPGPCGYGRLQKCGNAAQGYVPQCVALFQAAPVEICHNGLDDNCNGVIDESSACTCNPGTQSQQACSQAPSGLSGIGQCTRGKMTCGNNGVWSGCIGDIDPQEEQCDGQDNDCDGQVDESGTNLGKSCTVGGKKGECQKGKQTCNKSGKLVCTSATQPSTSDICNGLDDDCDGQTDEDDPQIGKPCAAPSKVGACAKGTLSCKSGKWSCDPTTVPGSETCNGIDDDCNGTIDDNLTAPPCDANPKPGICGPATKLCGGQLGWLDCQLGDYFRNNNLFEPKETKCDGKDNDCDGKVDNQSGSNEALKRPCYRTNDGTKGPDGTQNIGKCKAGNESCNAGKWSVCEGVALPSRLDCDGNGDADCNGRIDKDEPGCGCWGTGRDGSLTIKRLIQLDQVKASDIERTPPIKRTTPDIVSFQVTGINKNKLTLKQTPAGLRVGDEILLIHIQGESKRLGTFELRTVSEIDKQTLTLSIAINQTYGATDNSSLQAQLVMALRVPHYKRVVIAPGGHLTVGAWNGTSGGILVFRAQEVVRIDAGGMLSAGGAGYRGGSGVKGNIGEARAGEGGSSWPNAKTGTAGGGSGAANGTQASSGGGGGYGTAGTAGRDAKEQRAGAGGSKYGPDSGDLRTRIFMGGGGGGGAADSSDKGKTDSNKSGEGGAGGGIVFVLAHTLNITGRLHADGAPGQHAAGLAGRIGGGGGGAGGSVLLQINQLVRYEGGNLSAAGGAGGSGVAGATSGALPLPTAKGGVGGIGRIDVQLRALNGKATPVAAAFEAWSTPIPAVHEISSTCQ